MICDWEWVRSPILLALSCSPIRQTFEEIPNGLQVGGIVSLFHANNESVA
jgi:hypothetical protein